MNWPEVNRFRQSRFYMYVQLYAHLFLCWMIRVVSAHLYTRVQHDQQKGEVYDLLNISFWWSMLRFWELFISAGETLMIFFSSGTNNLNTDSLWWQNVSEICVAHVVSTFLYPTRLILFHGRLKKQLRRWAPLSVLSLSGKYLTRMSLQSLADKSLPSQRGKMWYFL